MRLLNVSVGGVLAYFVRKPGFDAQDYIKSDLVMNICNTNTLEAESMKIRSSGFILSYITSLRPGSKPANEHNQDATFSFFMFYYHIQTNQLNQKCGMCLIPFK